jgi:tetratricopeptide (TPR) repeat protein
MTGLVYCRMIEFERNTDKFEEATSQINKALDIYTEIKDKLGMERCYNNIGLVWLAAGRVEKDVCKLEEANQIIIMGRLHLLLEY